MLVSVADFRAATGDLSSADADIARSLTRMQSRIEGYLDRFLDSQDYTETHNFVGPEPVMLRQYPVSTLTSIDKDGTDIPVSDVLLNKTTGILYHKNKLTWAHDVEIVYTAGYVTCPVDIRDVIIDLAKAHLTGALDMSGPTGNRAVKKDTVYGVSAVEYESGISATDKVEFYPELGAYVRILEKYRRPYEVPKF